MKGIAAFTNNYSHVLYTFSELLNENRFVSNLDDVSRNLSECVKLMDVKMYWRISSISM